MKIIKTLCGIGIIALPLWAAAGHCPDLQKAQAALQNNQNTNWRVVPGYGLPSNAKGITYRSAYWFPKENKVLCYYQYQAGVGVQHTAALYFTSPIQQKDLGKSWLAMDTYSHHGHYSCMSSDLTQCQFNSDLT